MPHAADETPLPEGRRMEIFAALVKVQDSGVAVAKSRDVVAEEFGIDADLVRAIEEEGLDNEWPPL
jgi:hypothetical protein